MSSGTHGRELPAVVRAESARMSAADGQRRRARQRDDAVHLDDEARARKAVHEQQRRHHGERRADENGARVAAAPASVGQSDTGSGRDERREPDAPEVGRARELHLLRADEVDQRRRNDGRGTGRDEQRRKAIPPHDALYRHRSWGPVAFVRLSSWHCSPRRSSATRRSPGGQSAWRRSSRSCASEPRSSRAAAARRPSSATARAAS